MRPNRLDPTGDVLHYKPSVSIADVRQTSLIPSVSISDVRAHIRQHSRRPSVFYGVEILGLDIKFSPGIGWDLNRAVPEFGDGEVARRATL